MHFHQPATLARLVSSTSEELGRRVWRINVLTGDLLQPHGGGPSTYRDM
jgi:hypothetical protein